MGFRFYKRIGGNAGFNLSKSGITASLRTRAGSVGSGGYSIRTGVPGLFFMGGFGKGSKSIGKGSNSCGCIGFLIGVFILMALIKIAILGLFYLSPAMIGAALIIGSYKLMKWLNARDQTYVRFLFDCWVTLSIIISIGVSVFYYYHPVSDILDKPNLETQNENKIEGIAPRMKLESKAPVAVISKVEDSFTGVIEAKSDAMEIYNYELVNGSSVLLTSDVKLSIAASTNSVVEKNVQTIILRPGTIAVIDAVDSAEDFYFVRAYEMVQKSIFDATPILIGTGWIDANRCRAVDMLFSNPLTGDFLPVAPSEIKSSIKDAFAKAWQAYPSRGSLPDRISMFNASVYKYKEKRVLWQNPTIEKVSREKKDGFYVCTIKCSDLTASFEVSDKLATALNYNKQFYCKQILCIQGKIKTIDYWDNTWETSSNIILEDVFIIGAFLKQQ
jgi:hypothetical protein